MRRKRYTATFATCNRVADTFYPQDAIDTPDYTDSDTNPNTTASSVAGDMQTTDGRKRRAEELQLRKSVFGKKHSRLNESKVREENFSIDFTRCQSRREHRY